MGFFAAVIAMLKKDLRMELRSPRAIAPMALFALIVLMVFVFAVDPVQTDVASVFPGILWTGILFAGSVGLARMFRGETGEGSLQALVAAPVSRAAIYFGKFCAGLIFVGLIAGVMAPLLFLLFDQRAGAPWWRFAFVLGLVVIGYVAMGTLVSAITAQTRQSEVLLPILMFPLSVPLILAAVETTAALLEAGHFGGQEHWLYLVGSYDLLFLVLSPMLFDYVVEVS